MFRVAKSTGNPANCTQCCHPKSFFQTKFWSPIFPGTVAMRGAVQNLSCTLGRNSPVMCSAHSWNISSSRSSISSGFHLVTACSKAMSGSHFAERKSPGPETSLLPSPLSVSSPFHQRTPSLGLKSPRAGALGRARCEGEAQPPGSRSRFPLK